MYSLSIIPYGRARQPSGLYELCTSTGGNRTRDHLDQDSATWVGQYLSMCPRWSKAALWVSKKNAFVCGCCLAPMPNKPGVDHQLLKGTSTMNSINFEHNRACDREFCEFQVPRKPSTGNSVNSGPPKRSGPEIPQGQVPSNLRQDIMEFLVDSF